MHVQLLLLVFVPFVTLQVLLKLGPAISSPLRKTQDPSGPGLPGYGIWVVFPMVDLSAIIWTYIKSTVLYYALRRTNRVLVVPRPLCRDLRLNEFAGKKQFLN